MTLTSHIISEACWRVGGLEYEDICGPCNPGVHYAGAEKPKKPHKHSEDEVPKDAALVCPRCTQEQCDSDLNRCPVYKRAFVCTKGTSKGGCSGDPQFWFEEAQCGRFLSPVLTGLREMSKGYSHETLFSIDSCCEMTDCQKLKDKEAQKLTRDGNALEQKSCPSCPPNICYGKINQCPLHTGKSFFTNAVAMRYTSL